MQKQKPIAVFRGELGTAMREYSSHRMDREPKYKKTVYKAIARRKNEPKAKRVRPERNHKFNNVTPGCEWFAVHKEQTA